jgi:hypothetical protein
MLARVPALADGYTRDAFESGFAECFEIDTVHQIVDSERRLYLMRRKGAPA